MLTLYGDRRSGNCYKVELLLHLLERHHHYIEVDILAGDTRTPEFLTRNVNGKIPLLELHRGETLSESNAILNYLADGSDYLPSDPFLRAKVLQWQFFEQYSHEPYIATARFINRYLGLTDERRAEYAAKQDGGKRALRVMEHHLAEHDWLVGDRFTIADISLYAYTHVADEGGFALDDYPAIQAWLARVAVQPGHFDIPRD